MGLHRRRFEFDMLRLLGGYIVVMLCMRLYDSMSIIDDSSIVRGGER